jgi:flagellar biosynthesis protein FlhG
MFEARHDQAMGLRRLFGTPGIRVLPFACGAQPGGSAGFVLNLAAALYRLGRRPIVLDGDRGLLAPTLGLRARYDLVHLLAGEREFEDVAMRAIEGFSVMPAARGLSELVRNGSCGRALFTGFARLADPFDTILLCADPGMLAPLIGSQAGEAALVSGTDPRAIADAYARIKALRTVYGQDRFRIFYHRAASPSAAADSHERIASTASRFLGAAVAFGGVIEDEHALAVAERAKATVFRVAAGCDAARAFERIAASALEWPLPVFGDAATTLH